MINIYFAKARKGQKGQVAPFLIVIIIILLVAAIALINIGKMGTYKVDTANAVDAGVLAGGSMIASTENSISSDNFLTMLTALGFLAWFSGLTLNVPLASHLVWKARYLVFVSAMLSRYIGAVAKGARGMRDSRAITHQYIFKNSGIDEAVNATISGDRLVTEKSNLSKWMDDDSRNFQDKTYEYRWRQYGWNITESRQDPGQTESWVKSTVIKNPGHDNRGFIWLWPVPMVLPKHYWHWIGPCLKYCLPCVTDMAIFWVLYAALQASTQVSFWAALALAVGARDPMSFLGWLALAAFAPALTILSTAIIALFAMAGWIMIVFPPSPVVCNTMVYVWVLYIVPVAWIVNLVPADIGAEVIRYQPASNLGLWNINETTSINEEGVQIQGIKSISRAETYDGSVLSPNGGYKVKIKQVDSKQGWAD